MTVDTAHVIRALEQDQIVPVYQPVVSLRTGDITGFEVLARWDSAEHGLVLPHNFISIAEENGLIGNLTHQVMQKAFRAAAGIPQPICFAINISPIQMRYASLPVQVRETADEFAFPLDHLTIEITESALLIDLSRVQKVAATLKDFGCRLSLDDFGTGFSSLRHLQTLPFNDVKIDRSFVNDMTTSHSSRKIVEAVIGLGHSLGLTTVAEGIEVEEQAQILKWLGCERGQGWFYGRAVPHQSLADMTQQASATRPESTPEPRAQPEAQTRLQTSRELRRPVSQPRNPKHHSSNRRAT